MFVKGGVLFLEALRSTCPHNLTQHSGAMAETNHTYSRQPATQLSFKVGRLTTQSGPQSP